MGDTSIEWTMGPDGTPGKTWNPVRGCSRVSEGCRNCYAEWVAGRMSGPGQAYEGLVRKTGERFRWTGEVRLVPERLADPLRWKLPRRVFVNSMSDLFHERLSNEEIAAVFGVMAAAQRHTFQVLTKRPVRMRDWVAWAHRFGDLRSDTLASLRNETRRRLLGVSSGPVTLGADVHADGADWPLPNVWLGVSVEDQGTADERSPLLLETPAAVRFVSYEPALGPVDVQRYLGERSERHGNTTTWRGRGLDWVIAGSESGPGARPAELEWFRRVRDDCAAAGVPFFFKQWVGAQSGDDALDDAARARIRKVSLPVLDGRRHAEWPA